MQEIISKLLGRNKKVTLQDVASPKPSRTTVRVLGEVLRRAYIDQQSVSQKAHEIRTSN